MVATLTIPARMTKQLKYQRNIKLPGAIEK